MFKTKLAYYKPIAAASAGLVALSAAGTAHAAAAAAAGGNNFSLLATTISDSLADIPGLLSAICYLFGVILVILGIIKIKEHVEKPDQTPLKEGFIRLCIGGALFALPLILEMARETISGGATGAAVTSAKMKKVTFSTS